MRPAFPVRSDWDGPEGQHPSSLIVGPPERPAFVRGPTCRDIRVVEAEAAALRESREVARNQDPPARIRSPLARLRESSHRPTIPERPRRTLAAGANGALDGWAS